MKHLDLLHLLQSRVSDFYPVASDFPILDFLSRGWILPIVFVGMLFGIKLMIDAFFGKRSAIAFWFGALMFFGWIMAGGFVAEYKVSREVECIGIAIDAYSKQLEGVDECTLRTAVRSEEVGAVERNAILNYLNKQHPGWSIRACDVHGK